MKVAVLGAGVIGVTTAYYLARAGAQVTVIERQAGPAQETSFANAGQLSFGYSTPWAAPGIPLKALRWLFEPHAPLSVRPDGTLFQLRWLAAMLQNCSASRYATNKERMLRLATYSRECLRELREDTGIAYEGRAGGTLQLFRSEQQLDTAQRDIRILQACGVGFELLDRAGVCRVEPALAQAGAPIAGGLRLTADETGDCLLFTQALARLAQALGVQFRFDTDVEAFERDARGALTGVRLTEAGHEIVRADHYVLALGCESRSLLHSAGLEIPVYPVKGYSLTLPIEDEARAPVSTVIDETSKIALTRFERRIRVGGMAELAGFDRSLRPQRRATLEKVVRELFPGGDLARAEFWTGLRPMTPDGTPLVGPTPHANLFLNTGHGTLGWTMACGSGRLLADVIMGQPAAISQVGLAMDRYLRPALKPASAPAAQADRPPRSIRPRIPS